MSIRDLPPIAADAELEKPRVTSWSIRHDGPTSYNRIVLDFDDPVTWRWFTEYMRTNRWFEAFGDWADERR